MTREILFRAKRIDNGEWVEGAALMMDDGTYKIATSCIADIEQNAPLIVAAYDVNTDTVSQYTGLTDKNGTKIFENDICKMIYDGISHAYQIIWDNEELDFKGTNGKKNYASEFQYINCCEEVEVIGNIFDNQTAEDGQNDTNG